jgi:hypothetical protein
MVVNQRIFLLILRRKETWTKTQSKLCCVYIQYLSAIESSSSHIRVATTISRNIGNFIYFEVLRARMVTIRHSFDPEEFRAHESF